MQISIWQLVQFFEAANYGTKLHFADQTDVVLGLAVCNNKPTHPFQFSSSFGCIFTYFCPTAILETSLKL